MGPMSPQIIEAVYSYAQAKEVPLMLIASKNQVDYNRGYVFTTARYREFLDTVKQRYPRAQVAICRDHCGPGHNSVWDLKDTYETINADLAAGFDLIHIDFCFHRGPYEDILKESRRAIAFIQKHSPSTLIEIGTDENSGMGVENTHRVEEQMKFFTSVCEPHFFVTQTGTLIREMYQEGMFHEDYVKKLRLLADQYNLHLKEHNADYLDAGEIRKRHGLVDAMNIAPQLGVLQTKLTIFKGLLYGLKVDDFLNISYRSHKWEKWLSTHDSRDTFFCSLVAGHYNFATPQYRRLYEELLQYEDFNVTLQQELWRLLDLYITNLEPLPHEHQLQHATVHITRAAAQ